jgi:copper oxidase (laccase) domain-containing protein
LWDLNWHQLVAAGLRADQIEVMRLCTRCRPDLFYSHRRDAGRTGRFGLLAAMAAS